MKVFKYIYFLNGQKYKLYTSKFTTFQEILNYLNYLNKLNIIEFNGKILSTCIQTLYIKNKDYLEIITIVGGG